MSPGPPPTPNFEALFKASPNAYLLLDTDLRIVEANDSYLDVTGRKRQEILDQHVFEAFPGDPEVSADSNKERIQASFERVLSTGEQQSIALMPYVIPRKTDEGEVFHEERYWSVTLTPIFGEDEEIEFILKHSSDVTDLYEEGHFEGELNEGEFSAKESDEGSARSPQEEGETSLQAQEVISRAEEVQKAYWESESQRERLRRLFDQAPGFMAFVYGPDHVFKMANEAYYELVGRRDVLGKPVREALPEVVGQGFPELLDQVYESGEPFVGREVEIHLEREPGDEPEPVYVDFIYQPVADPKGETIGIFVQGHDVTEQKKAKDRLKQRKAELEKLNKTLEDRVEERTSQVRKLTSHVTRAEQRERRRIGQLLHDDLQQRLYGSQLRAQSLQSSLDENGQTGLAEEAEAVGSGIEEVVQSMRNLAVGTSPPVLENEGLTAALEWLRSHMEEAYGLEVSLEAEREFRIEEEMRVLLFQTARELLSNVHKHSGVSEATARLFEEESDLVLEVTDKGKGFDPEQVDIESPQGSFGLTAARERLRLFGGELTARSIPGEGTQVTVRLPIEQSLKSTPATPADGSPEKDKAEEETQEGKGQKQ